MTGTKVPSALDPNRTEPRFLSDGQELALSPQDALRPEKTRPGFVLASASPRRRELLARVGLYPEVRPVDVDESSLPSETPLEEVCRVAQAKAMASDASAVLAADTVVAIDGRSLGKPRDRVHAERLLCWLSGRTHWVHTAVVLRIGARLSTEVVTTEVRFRPLMSWEIRAYLQSGEADDKAGAYAIQGDGGSFVDRIDGSYTNVIGLPLEETMSLLKRERLWRPPALASEDP